MECPQTKEGAVPTFHHQLSLLYVLWLAVCTSSCSGIYGWWKQLSPRKRTTTPFELCNRTEETSSVASPEQLEHSDKFPNCIDPPKEPIFIQLALLQRGNLVIVKHDPKLPSLSKMLTDNTRNPQRRNRSSSSSHTLVPFSSATS